MFSVLRKHKDTFLFKTAARLVVSALSFSLALGPSAAQAQAVLTHTILNLPAPGTMVTQSGGFTAPRLIGVTVHPDNPLKFDFIVNSGDADLAPDALKEESRKLIKYFLASLTVPEDELWVNLSPHERDRMIPQGLGDTEMGRDMLAQDYLLKQLTASLMYPEKELGQKFWEKIYKEAREKYGTTQIPVNTFNKVWVVPEKAVVYEHGNRAFVVSAHLKVMLEQDYAIQQVDSRASMLDTRGPSSIEHQASGIEAEIIREILLPAIEREVNEGENFANLRQMYHSLILAAWYKLKLKDGLLGKIYVDQNKTKGIDTTDKTVNQKIYDQYLESFKKGVYNYIKEDVDPATQDVIPRKYFSGGLGFGKGILAMVAASLIISGSSVHPAYATDMIAQGEKGKNNSVEVVLGENPLKSAEETLAALEPSIDEQNTNDETASSPVEVGKVKEDVLAGIKEARKLLEGLSAKVEEGIVPSGINILKYTALLNALRAASLKDGGGKDASIPAASLLNITERKNLGSRIQGILATLNGNANTSEEDKKEITRALNSLQENLKKFKAFEDVIFQEASLDEQLKKVSRAFNRPEVNIFYALRNAVNKEKLERELAGILGVTLGDDLKERMIAANMIYRADDAYILRPDFLTSPKLKKITSGISKGLVGMVEKAILDSVDVNNFVAALAWDSRKSEEEIVQAIERQKRLSSLADRWRAFHAQENDETALREAVERANGIAGDFIKSHPIKSGEFVLAVRVAPDEKSTVVTTAIQSPSGSNERASRILLFDLSKGGAGVKVLHEASETQYNSPFNRIAFFDEGKAVAVWNLSRQIKWDIRDPENPRPVGWQEEETWAQGTSSSPAAARVEEIKGLLQEIEKERQTPGSGNLPQVAVLSDFHGGLNRFIMLLSDVLNNLAGFQGQLDPNRTIGEQLTAQGLSFKDIKGQIILGGDILDRGKHGIKIFLLIKELVEKGEGKIVSVTGNHDFWAFANLLGMHLPWYKGFQFYGDTEAENLIARYRQTNPELFDTPESVLWWTERLAEHNADQDAYQKKAFDGKVTEVRNRFIEDYKTFQKNWTDPQKDAMEKFIGYFARIDVTDPYVGLNGLGKTSALWWKQVFKQINQGYEARRSLGAEDAELSVWQEAIALAEKISRDVDERLDQALRDGKWWYRVFESINTHAYRSVEWSAKDWSSHKGWGDSVIAEINEMIAAGLIHEEKLTQKNYIQSPTLQALAHFYGGNFNLYAFTPYGDLFSHGGFPVNFDGTINIFYKGVMYKGNDIFSGLSAVSTDVKDTEKSLQEIWEALHLVNTWYADMTTELKPAYIKRNIDQIGISKINKGIGVRHHVTGHNPIALGKLAGRPFMAGDSGYTHAFADFGMSEKYGGQGGWVSMSAAGIKLRGFESETSDALVDNPYTHVWDKETGQIKKTIENPGLEGNTFLTGAKEQLSEELARLEASSPVRQIDSNLARFRQDQRDLGGWEKSDLTGSEMSTPGGIDLNPALLDLQIKRDGNGVPLPLPMQPIEDMHIEGFLPIIINVTPVTNLPLLLGLVDTEQDADEITPAMKAREPEEVSYLN